MRILQVNYLTISYRCQILGQTFSEDMVECLEPTMADLRGLHLSLLDLLSSWCQIGEQACIMMALECQYSHLVLAVLSFFVASPWLVLQSVV